LSELGLKRKGARGGGYRGRVISVRDGMIPIVRVLFDGNRSPTTIHAKFLVAETDP
jgi:hypothetical protein